MKKWNENLNPVILILIRDQFQKVTLCRATIENAEQRTKGKTENEKGKTKTKHELFIRSLYILPQKERLCVVRKLEAGKYCV